MSRYVHKSHNVSVLIYHFVCPAKYRKVIFSKEVDDTLKEICLEISKRYEISFFKIGTDRDHVHFLIQSIPKYSVTKIMRMIKSITAKKIFEKHPEAKKQLWGGEFWSDVNVKHFSHPFGKYISIRWIFCKYCKQVW